MKVYYKVKSRNTLSDKFKICNLKVSVLVPVYGVEKYIERCALSLFSQTYGNIEYIFVNDCSIDKSMDVLQKVVTKFPNRIDSVRVISHETNRGVGSARNTGLESATGDYILFVDSDDYIEPDMVEALCYKTLENDSDIVFCSFRNEFNNGKSAQFNINKTFDKVELINDAYSHPALWNKMFKRKLFLENDLHIYKGINYGEDLALLPRLLFYANSFAFVEKPLYHYIQFNSDSYTRKFTDENLKQTLKVIDLLSDFFANKEGYEDGILLLKAIRKAKILRSGRTEKQYADLFPEINSSTSTFHLDSKSKILLFLAAKKQYKLLSVFVKLLVNRRKNYLASNAF